MNDAEDKMPLNPSKRADVREIGRGIAGTVHGSYSLARHCTDWAKPTWDSFFDAGTFLAATNSVVALGVYAANRGIEQLVGAASYAKWDKWLDNHGYVHFALDAVAYTAIFGLANVKYIVPKTREIFGRVTTPSGKNWLKTVGLGAAW